jgi:hypothetical protein
MSWSSTFYFKGHRLMNYYLPAPSKDWSCWLCWLSWLLFFPVLALPETHLVCNHSAFLIFIAEVYCTWWMQIAHLEEWSHLDRGHSSSLEGATEALKASTLRLPVVGKTVVCSFLKHLRWKAAFYKHNTRLTNFTFLCYRPMYKIWRMLLVQQLM